MVADHNEVEGRLYNHTNQLLRAHETLLSDGNRNRSFYRALKKTVTKTSSVLDIGSGTGVWAVAAAKLGARRVVAVEEEPLLIGLIKQIARDNGVASKVEVVQGDSRQIQLGKEFDIVISETIGHLVFDEPIVPIMIDARKRFLKSGGILIPRAVALVAAGAHLNIGRQILPASVPIDQSGFQSLSLNSPIALQNRAQLRIRTDPQKLIAVDLMRIEAPPDLDNLAARWQNLDARKINCFAVWAEATLAPRVNVIARHTTSWLPMVYRVKPFSGKRGDIEFRLSLSSKTNYWTATLTSDGAEEVQSFSPAFAAAELLARTRTDHDVFSHAKRIGISNI